MQQSHNTSPRSGIAKIAATTTNIAFADGISLVAIAVFVVLLGRTYGSAALGQFSFAVAATGFAQTICDAGFDISLPRRISRDLMLAKDLTVDALSSKLQIAYFVVPLSVAASLAKDNLTIVTTIIFAFDVIPTAFSYALSSSLRGMNRASQAARINALYNALPVSGCIAALYLGAPIYFFALLLTAGDSLKFFHLRRLFNACSAQPLALRDVECRLTIKSDRWRRVFSEQGGVTATNLLSSVILRTPSLLLGWFSTDSLHGMYVAALRFFTALRIVPGAVLNAVLPEYASRSTDAPRIRRLMLWSFAAALGCGSFLYFGAPYIIGYTFAYAESVVILQILAPGFVALFMKTVFEALLLAANRERILNIILLCVSTSAVVAYYFVLQYGLRFVALVTSLSEFSLLIALTLVFVWFKFSDRVATDEKGLSA